MEEKSTLRTNGLKLSFPQNARSARTSPLFLQRVRSLLLRAQLNRALLAGLCLLVSGCASFPGREIPDYAYTDLAPAPAEKICLRVLETVPEENRQMFEESIAVLEKSGFFSKAPEHCTSTGNTVHYALSVKFKNDLKTGNMAVALVSGFISGFTLTLIPAYGRDDFVMTAEIKADGQLLKKYVYKDHINTWIHVTMLFEMSGHRPRAVINEMYHRMLMNFLYDFSRDVQKGLLQIRLTLDRPREIGELEKRVGDD